MTYNGHDFNVQVELSFDPSSGLIRTTFLSIDPATDFPPDVLTGFLPPEDGTGRGLGYFSYAVRTKTGLTSGTEIRNVGLISFDEQTIIGTNQVNPHNALLGIDPKKEALITIDAVGPTSSVNALATTQSSTNFSVTWSGTDDVSGSGIGDYDIYVSDNNGLFTRWLIGTKLTSASYIGQNGHSYSFFSVATDNVGHHEATPSSADTSTTVNSNSPPSLTTVSLTPTTAYETSTLTATPAGGADADGDPITYSYQWFVNGSPIAPTTSTLTGTYFNKGNTVSVRVTPNDGTASGTPVDSNTVTISNSSPTAISQSVTTPKDTTKIIPLAGNDVDGDSLTFVVVSSPTHGSLSGTAPNLTYVPSANYVGSDSFSYRANDGMLDSNLAVVTIAITPVNVAPVIDMLSSTSVNENGTVHLTGTYRVAGTQGTQTLTINWGEGTPQSVTVMDGSFDITHQYQDDNPTKTASDVYAIAVQLTDAFGTASKRTSTTITNLAPVFVGSIAGPSTAVPGQIARYSATFSDVGKLDSHTVIINWGDGNTTTGTVSETLGTGVGTVSGSHTYASHGTYMITFAIADDDQGVTAKSISLATNQSIFVLHSTVAGAFTSSGNGIINIAGVVVVDSNSSSAITASGNVRLTAARFDVVGGIKTTGNAQLIGPVTHTFVPDPLAGLATPALGAVQAAVNVSGNSSRTINPGTYSSITVSGKGFLTLTPGVYILSGGGFSVSGNGRVTGSGVSIVNMASATGSTGSINFSGNGDVTLTPTTSGPLTGILIFQPSNNTKALTISGNASAGINGTIYAPKAQLNISGNGSFTETIIVDRLTLSGNGSNLVAAATSSPVATSNSWVMYTSSTTGVEGLGLTKYDQSLRTNNGYIEEIEGRDQLFASLATAPAKPGMAGSNITRKAKTDTLGLVDSEKEELLEEDLLEAIALYRIA